MIAACFFFVGLPVWATIGAFVLKASVALSNKVLGAPPPLQDDWDDDWDGYEPDRPPPRRLVGPVPPQSFVNAAGIAAALGVVNAIVLGLSLEYAGPVVPEEVSGLVWAGALAVVFLVDAGLFKVALPTTFPRACLVTLFYAAVTALIAGACAAVVMGFVWFAVFGG